jgi:hypothetical protein
VLLWVTFGVLMIKQTKLYIVLSVLLVCIYAPVNAQFFKRLLAPDTSKTVPKKHKLLGIPVISRAPETDWAFGFAGTWFFRADMRDSTVRTSNLQFISLYTLRNQFVAELEGTFILPGERFYIKMHNSFSRYPYSFWGIGNNTPNSNKERFSFQQFHVNPTLMARIKPRLFAGLVVDVQKFYKVEYTADGVFDQQNVPGRYGSLISGAGLMFLYDTRDNLYNARKGFYSQFSYINYNKLIGSEYPFSQYILDIRKYFVLYKKHTLALQAYNEYNGPGDVPFRNLARMGGDNRMRGYFSGRYTDKAHMAYQVEYRYPIWWRFSGTLFAATGQVAPSLKAYRIDAFKFAYGFGLRFMANRAERINLRFDYGFVKGGGGYYFTISEAF